MKALRSALLSTRVTTISMEVMTTSMSRGAVEHQFAVRLATVEGCVQCPQLDPQAPAIVLALDMNQVIARTPVLAVGRRRCRRHAQHRDRPGRALDARRFAAVIVPVQDELAADPADHRLEIGGVGEMLPV